MLTLALIGAALAAGLAGGWSPCGLSMVETLTSARGRRGRAAGAAAFVAGALAGGVVTFGGLALLGRELGGGGEVWTALAVLALVAASGGDGAGRRIVPQVRRQVPESWRRRLPLPLASGLYGVLLGLGFTTFVLSFATYALAACALALGDPPAGALIGVAFAAGRAVPVVAAAPWPDGALAAAMADRPGVLRLLRVAAAGVLLVAAFGVAAAPAGAAGQLFTSDGGDPSAAGGVLAWEAGSGTGLVLRDGRTDQVPGTDPALGGGLIAWHDEPTITVSRLDSFAPIVRIHFAGAEELAVTSRWLAWVARDEEGTARIYVIDLNSPLTPPRVIAVADGVGRPSIDGDRLVYHVAGTQSSRIMLFDLLSGERTTLRRSIGSLLLNPTLVGDRLLYVESSATRQMLQLGDLAAYGGVDRALLSLPPTARRDAGHEPGKDLHHAGYPKGRRPRMPARPRRGVTISLWTTAIDGNTAYVTSLRHRRGVPTQPSILKVPIPPAPRHR